jgi:hypothetical protein
MGFSYLGNKSWKEVTRDERTFCTYLFNAFKEKPEELVHAITSKPYLIDGFKEDTSFSNKKWELGYEVCLYRDLLMNYGIRIREKLELLKEWGIYEPTKLIKRTFDLCLFSEDEIIIIEAKAAEGLTSSQFIDFQKDFRDNIKTLDSFGQLIVKEEVGGRYIQKIFEGLKIKNPSIKIPKVKLVVLASSEYFSSKSFKKDVKGQLGVGGRFILNKTEEARAVHSLISWESIYEYMKENDIGSLDEKYMVRRADLVYLSKINREEKEQELASWYLKNHEKHTSK